MRVSELTFEGSENLIYRVPARSVSRGQVLIRSDDPFSVLFVLESEDGVVRGIDPATGFVETYRPTLNALGSAFFVTVLGPDGLFAEDRADGSMLALLAMAQGNAGPGAADNLLPLLLLRQHGASDLDERALVALLLSQRSSGGAENDSLGLVLALRAMTTEGQEKDADTRQTAHRTKNRK